MNILDIFNKISLLGLSHNKSISLLNYIDTLNENGYKFILSNTFKHRNVINQDLINWSSKYNVKYINMSYNSWSAAVKSVKNEKETNEVIISNFIF